MRKEVRLEFADKLLGNAVRILLAESGFDVTGELEAPLVTDRQELCISERALYIGREEPTGDLRYLHRPFLEGELISAVGELTGADAEEKKNGIRIDKRRSLVYFDGERILLTEKEFKLFALLLQHRGSAVSDAEIVEKVFDGETVQGSNIAAVYVNYLRKKIDERLGRKTVFRVRGQGYMLK